MNIELDGYVRVSTLDQNKHRQLEGIELDKTFLDKASGKDVKRPQLTAMLDFVREGGSDARRVKGEAMRKATLSLGNKRVVELIGEAATRRARTGLMD